MKGKYSRYLKRIGGFVLAALMLSGIVFVSPNSVEAQRRGRVVIVRPYRPFGFGFRNRWGYPYDRWGYDPWSPYGSA